MEAVRKAVEERVFGVWSTSASTERGLPRKTLGRSVQVVKSSGYHGDHIPELFRGKS